MILSNIPFDLICINGHCLSAWTGEKGTIVDLVKLNYYNYAVSDSAIPQQCVIIEWDNGVRTQIKHCKAKAIVYLEKHCGEEQ